MSDEAADPQDEAEWHFEYTPPELYWALPEADRVGIEQIIRDMIEKKNSKH